MVSSSDPDLQEGIDNRIRFERLLADLATSFVGLPPDQVDGAIEVAQRRIGETLGLDRSSLFQFTADGEMVLTHSWVAPGLQPYPPRISAKEHFPWGYQKGMRGEIVRFSSVSELPPEAARDLETFRKHGPKSTVVFPLRAGGQVFGGLAFGTLRAERHWTDDAVARLRVAASLFESTLARKRSEESLRQALDEVRRLRDQLQREVVYLQGEVEALHGHADMTGTSAVLREVLTQVDRVAPTDATVLLVGETGTGKELLARHVHVRSPRAAAPLIRVNCAAIAPGVFESELFGHERGAFTGALERRVGRFELAHGGTLFLDEIGELPLEIQVKLLRVLQEGEVERVGSGRPIPVDVRVVAATNRDLEADVAVGRFRADLFYRLNVFPVRVPPLRERPEDLPLLIDHFLAKLRRKLGKPLGLLAPESLARLRRYPWPGNVRELQNVLERSCVLATGEVVEVVDALRADAVPSAGAALRSLEEIEREHILLVLGTTHGVIQGTHGAARILGLHPNTLRSRMERLGILNAATRRAR